MVNMGAFTYHAVGKSGPAGLTVRRDTDCQHGVDYRYLTDARRAINGQLAPIVRPDPCRR